MSVRLRLTLWYVLLLAVIVIATSGLVERLSDTTASDTVDRTLIEQAHAFAAHLQLGPPVRFGPGSPDESSLGASIAPLWIRVLNEHGRVLAVRGAPPAWLATIALDRRGAGSGDVKLSGDSRSDRRHIRLYVLPLHGQGKEMLAVQSIADMRSLDADRERLLRALLVSAAAALVAAGLGGFFLADHALRPVARITRLAAQIGAGDLHRRVGDELHSQKTQHHRPDELMQLASTFDDMLARLEEAGRRQRQLTADAAHELCTPVATIVANAEITLDRPRAAEEYQSAMRQVLDEARHMNRLVDDLLTLARADAGGLLMEREPVEVGELCRQAIEAFRPIALASQVELKADLPSDGILVAGDELRLLQVVRNLVDNALRHTPAGGAVGIELRREQRATALVVLRVRDSGPGIPAEERDRVFERFHRVLAPPTPSDTVAGRRAGNGLGLAICRSIVEAHGGRIYLEPEDRRWPGAHVVVELPEYVESI